MTENKAQTKTPRGGGGAGMLGLGCIKEQNTNKYGKSTKREKEKQFKKRAVCLWPSTTEAWVLFQASPCDLCGGQCGTRIGFSPSVFGFSLSLSFHHCSILIRH